MSAPTKPAAAPTPPTPGSLAQACQDMSERLQKFSAYVHGALRLDLDASDAAKGKDIDGAMHCFKAAAGYMDAARSMLRKADARLEKAVLPNGTVEP